MSKPASDIFSAAWGSGWLPDKKMSVSAWSDTNIRLDSKSSPQSTYRTSKTPYVKEPMDCLGPDSPVKKVVLVWAAQTSKSQTMLCWLGSIIDQAPGSVMLVQPTVEMAKKFSKQRISPMIENCPALKSKVSDGKEKDATSTILEKQFPGGILMLTGANSPASLRSSPIRYAACDEIDAYPEDAGGEGDPVSLVEKRTSNFANKKILLTSTPTIKGHSAIEREFLQGDQRYYYVPCPHCSEKDVLKFDRLVFDSKNLDAGVRMVCRHCGALIDEGYKTEMLEQGEWRAHNPSGNGTRSYHISALYSPLGWKSWRECVEEFLAARDNPEKLKVWMNTVLAETWEERGDGASPDVLKTRREQYEAEVPDAVRIITCAVDVQKDRLEVKVKGYGADEESWLLAYHVINGEPGQGEVWAELDEFIRTRFTKRDGTTMEIDTTVVDSGGWHTNHVYRYCKSKVGTGQRVYAIKGHQFQGKAIISNPSYNNAYRVKLFIVGVDAAKDLVVSRMQIPRPGPGYMHLPEWCDDDYLNQLTSEKAIRKYVRGKGTVRQWVKAPHLRNEAFDLEVYCLAALYTRGHAFLTRVLGTGSVVARKEPDPAEAEQLAQSEAAEASKPATATSAPQQVQWGTGRQAGGWGSRPPLPNNKWGGRPTARV